MSVSLNGNEGDVMAEKQYTYAVARIRAKELSLLGKQFIEQLLASKRYEDCLQLLADKGWGGNKGETMDQLLAYETERTWLEISELVEDMSVFNTFLYEKDFHNLKAAIKQVYTGDERSDIYIKNGTIEPKVILEAVRERNFMLLPVNMQTCAEQAYNIQLQTGDSQLCDIIIDRAALETLYESGKSSGNKLFEEYAEIRVASANIKIALRSIKTGKNREFIERALACCDSLDKKRLINSIFDEEDGIFSYLNTTVYSSAIDVIKESPSAFEKWCDNLLIEKIKPQKYNPFTLSPLAAFILARENEIKTVRILLTGKKNSLSEDKIRERLRDMYV